MPARGIHHVDLAVADVGESIAFSLDLLGPLGWREHVRYPTHRGTEEVVYLGNEQAALGIRPADGGGAHRYYGVGIEHWPSRSIATTRWITRTPAASRAARGSTSHP